MLLDQERDTARVLVGPPWRTTYLDLAGLRAPRIEDDLLARDFTVNAMAVPVTDWQAPSPLVIDPAGGRRDLERGLLRAVSSESFSQDPLRLMRAVRLSGSLGLELESESRAWARRDAALLPTVAHERVRDELAQIVDLVGPEHWCRLLEDLGLLAEILPDLARLREVILPEAGFDALEQAYMTLSAIDTLSQALEGTLPWAAAGWPFEALGARLAPYAQRLVAHLHTFLPGGHRAGSLLRLAALLHNVARGAPPPAPSRLLDYETLGASVAATLMRQLCFSGAEVGRVRQAVQAVHRPLQLAEDRQGEVSRRQVYRFYQEADGGGVDAVLLSLADHLASAQQEPERGHWERHVAVARRLLHAHYEQHDQVVAPPPLLDGHDLMAALDLAEGPELGALLDSLRELQAAGEVDTREQALGAARRLLEQGSHP